MGQLYPQLQAAQTEVLVILGEGPDKTGQYAELLQIPFPVLSDPERDVYHLFDLYKEYMIVQRSATVMVRKDGSIGYLKRATSPFTWLKEARDVLALVESLNETPTSGQAG